jgi:adenylate cyclase
MPERIQRRLVAIVSADVVGYSRLMGVDEIGTLSALNAHRSELIDPLVEKHGGRIVKTTGDGLLLEFPSVVTAVECSIAVQNGMTVRNAALSDDTAMCFRVGVHLGDIIVEGDDIFGDGVNVAARLEALSEANGLALSDDAYRQVRDRIDVDWQDDGEHEVKNIARPVHVWRWSPSMIQPTPSSSRQGKTLALPDKPSIAVLPFDNMSDDLEQEYFADGIAEDVITALSRFRSLFVISRNSSFTYKGSAVDITQVARDLGVRYVVEGSVRKAGNRVRITAQLIDAASGNHLWADRFDGNLDDVFELQDQITERIVFATAPEIEAHERERARRKPPESLDAWELYQRGMWHFYRVTKGDLIAARTLFDKAIARDPDFALPHAGIAYVCFLEVFQGYDTAHDEFLVQGLAAGERAVALDDKDGFAHLALSRMLHLTGQGERAIAEAERSVALNSSFALGYYGLGAAFDWQIRATEGIVALDMSMRLSPQDPMLWAMQTKRASCCFSIEKYDEAEEWARKAVNVRPDIFQTEFYLAMALVGLDRLNEARAAIEAARRARSDLSISVYRHIVRHAKTEFQEPRIAALRKAGLPEL